MAMNSTYEFDGRTSEITLWAQEYRKGNFKEASVDPNAGGIDA